MNKNWFYLCSLLLLFTGCHKDDTPENLELRPPSSSKRVVLAYLISNNSSTNLDSYLKENIKWMYEGLAAAKDTCSLLVFYRPYAYDQLLPNPSILSFTSDGKGRINKSEILTGSELNATNVLKEAYIEKEYTESGFNATSPATMRTVFSDMQRIISAPSYGLIFGSHGTGWLEGNPTLPNRSFGDDKRYSINVPEMSNAIQSAFNGKKADFILFDACMMGTAEVYYEFRNTASNCIASVLETPLDGLPYNTFFPTLYEKYPDYAQIVDNAIEYNKKAKTWGTYAWVDLSQMDDLARAMAEELTQHDELAKRVSYTSSSLLLQYGYGSSFRYFSFDMMEFIKLLNNGNVPENFKAAFDKAVLHYNSLSDNNYLRENERYCGMGMYLPDRGIRSTWDTYYPSLAWYQAAGWETIK